MNDPTKSIANIIISNIETDKEYKLILKPLLEINSGPTTKDSSESLVPSSSDNLFSAQKLPHGIKDDNNNYTSVIQLIYRITELTQFLINNKQQIISHYPPSTKIEPLINILIAMKQDTVNKLAFRPLVATSQQQQEDPANFLEATLKTFDCFSESPFKLCYSKENVSSPFKKLPKDDPRNFFTIQSKTISKIRKLYIQITNMQSKVILNSKDHQIQLTDLNEKLAKINYISILQTPFELYIKLDEVSYKIEKKSIASSTQTVENTVENTLKILSCENSKINKCIQDHNQDSIKFNTTDICLEFTHVETKYTFSNYIIIKLQQDNITYVEQNIKPDRESYELVAMLVAATTTGKIHYFTFAKYEGNIYKFDNDSIDDSTPVTTEFNNIIQNSSKTTKPYILLYRKKSDNLFPTPTLKVKLEEYLEDV